MALEDVKAYLLEECGQIAVRLLGIKHGLMGSSKLPRAFGGLTVILSDLGLVEKP